MRSLLVGVLFSTVLSSCLTKTIDPNSIEGKLVTAINTTCRESSTCTIRLRDVTDFNWDRVYVFTTTSQSEIEKVIGAPFPGYQEFQRSIIFFNGGKIVYSESLPTDIERPLKNQVMFDIAGRSNYRVYSSESQFEVERKNDERAVYYKLTLIQSPQIN
jgi:hypothetical protein